MEIVCVVGARPNFMKIAPVLRALEAHGETFTPVLVHTGQHYDEKMSDVFFEQLGIRKPDVYLGVGSGSHAKQTAAVMVAIEELLLERKSDMILVVGDVNSTVAAALAAAKLNIPVGHIESGLRSRDRDMPEEINRLVVDGISDLLFTPSPDGDENLIAEGHPTERIFCVGNVMIDTLLVNREKARASTALEDFGVTPGEYVLVTMHRPSNVDQKKTLQPLLEGIRRISEVKPVVLPLHPRTKAKIEEFHLVGHLAADGIILAGPQSYLDFLALQAEAGLVVTDSGGIQEETSALGVPCLTVRENTERPVTITHGTNELVGQDAEKMVSRALSILSGESKPGQGSVPEFWDGHASERIVDVILDHFDLRSSSNTAAA